ncbi:hypothetical protein QWM81_24975 [Streptomyces ficellus]|uniref:Uncharacterized protein n=1 Tax=Streptomyces ficellus TaxID=1977088 RepID=A0ABT7ZDB4_9ACTN|nr:hypothetical protein [Streptomyces ficellus]MDN3297237.1 hypothetical protein [Streptomyces ficellus]
MKENGNSSYQAELRKMSTREAGEAASDPLPNADRREDFVDAVADADLPQMVKVLLYELASRLNLSLSDWDEGSKRVRFEEEELARSIGLEGEAADLCLALAVEANWLVEVEGGVVDLRTPHEDWQLYLGALSDVNQPIENMDTYESRLDAFARDIERLRSTPIMSVRRIIESMVTVIGHTFEPLCIGSDHTSQGLGSGAARVKPKRPRTPKD